MKESYSISSICLKCDSCLAICPNNAIIIVDNEYHIDDWACHKCSLCVEICPVNAIKSKETQS